VSSLTRQILALAIPIAFGLLACPQSIQVECGPDNCTGCCFEGSCLSGDQLQACGSAGGGCQVCVEEQTNCVQGRCVAVTASDAGPDAGGRDAGGHFDAGGLDASSEVDAGAMDSGNDGGTLPDAGCTPACAGKSCGPNGCNGVCGTCPGGEMCTTAGQCVSADGGLCGTSACVGPTIAAGGVHSCALNASGTLRCWGTNDNGELGDGNTTATTTPTSVIDLASNVVAVSTGDWHTCAILGTSGLQCWGDNMSGEIGDGTTCDDWVPTGVVGLGSGVAGVSAGSVHTCAVTSEGSARCWGSNLYGQIGDGSGADQHLPVTVSGLTSGVQAVTASGHHSCALLTGGAVVCWGENTYGELGNGTTNDAPTPVNVSSLSTGASAVSAGNDDTCAMVSGGVQCWGENDLGQVGNGVLSSSQPTPANVTGLAGPVISLAVGGSHACVIVSGGAVQCWGSNNFGQIGDGTNTNRSAATSTMGLSSGVVEIAAGSGHSCARLSTGEVRCWGRNTEGQLGDGSNTNSSVPVTVSSL
jgi:alpha-tubulin suppressor-like RCC1 family protein